VKERQHNIIQAHNATKICGKRSTFDECIGLAAMGSRRRLLSQIQPVANTTHLWRVYMYCAITVALTSLA